MPPHPHGRFLNIQGTSAVCTTPIHIVSSSFCYLFAADSIETISAMARICKLMACLFRHYFVVKLACVRHTTAIFWFQQIAFVDSCFLFKFCAGNDVFDERPQNHARQPTDGRGMNSHRVFLSSGLLKRPQHQLS